MIAAERNLVDDADLGLAEAAAHQMPIAKASKENTPTVITFVKSIWSSDAPSEP